MKKALRVITISVLAMAFAGVFTACGTADEPAAPATPTPAAAAEATPTPEPATPADPADEPVVIRIGWTPPDVTGVFATVTQFMEAAIASAEPYGIIIEVVERPPTDHAGVAEQVAVIENFIIQGVDAIMVSPTDVDGITPALREINDAGIPLIMVNMMSEIPGVDVTSFVGFDNRIAAEVTGWSMINALGGPGPLPQAGDEQMDVPADVHLNVHWWRDLYSGFDKESITGRVAIIEGIHGDYFSNARNAGFLDVIDQFPNIEVLTILPGDWNRARSVEQAENILHMFGPGEIDAIFAPSSEMGFGARIAIESAGREEVMVLTHGGTMESGDWIRDQRLLVDTWHGFPDWGWYSVKFAVMTALGQEVPYMHDIGSRTQWYDNAHMFFPDVQLAPIPWQEILDNRN